MVKKTSKIDISDEMIAERRGGSDKMPDDMPLWMAKTFRIFFLQRLLEFSPILLTHPCLYQSINQGPRSTNHRPRPAAPPPSTKSKSD